MTMEEDMMPQIMIIMITITTIRISNVDNNKITIIIMIPIIRISNDDNNKITIIITIKLTSFYIVGL
jgi:hypothetical protein